MNSTHIFAGTTVLLAAIICFGFATAPNQSPHQDLESRVRTSTPTLAHKQHFGHRTTLPTPTPIDNQQVEPYVVPPVSAPTAAQRTEDNATPPTPTPIDNQQVEPCAALPLVPSADTPENCDATPDSSLIYYQRFENGMLVDEVGNFPNGSLAQGSIIPGKDGNALHIQAHEAGAVVSMPAGSIGPAGCIEFWARIDNGDGLCTGTSFCPQFFSVFADGDSRVGIDFCTNFGHYDCGATFHFWGLAFATTYKGCKVFSYGEILETNPADWHHYAITWDVTGLQIATPEGTPTPTGALFIDGNLQLYNGNASTFTPETFLQRTWWLKKPLYLNFSYFNPPTASYAIDEFKIWNCPKMSFK